MGQKNDVKKIVGDVKTSKLKQTNLDGIKKVIIEGKLICDCEYLNDQLIILVKKGIESTGEENNLIVKIVICNGNMNDCHIKAKKIFINFGTPQKEETKYPIKI